MGEQLYKISAYLNKEELRQFTTWVKARGVGQSGFIREQLSFEVRPRGAPKGQRKKARKVKPVESKVERKKRGSPSSATKPGESQLSFLD